MDERRAVEAVEPPDQQRRSFALDERRERRADRVRPHRRAQRKRAAGQAIIGRALAHEIAAQLVQPIEDLDPLIGLDPRALDPGLGDFEAADRPVHPPLPGALEPRGRRINDSDEGEPGIEQRRRVDRDLVSRTSFSLTMIPEAAPQAAS